MAPIEEEVAAAMVVGMVGDGVGGPVVGHCGSGQEKWQKEMALTPRAQGVGQKKPKMAPVE